MGKQRSALVVHPATQALGLKDAPPEAARSPGPLTWSVVVYGQREGWIEQHTKCPALEAGDQPGDFFAFIS